MRQSSAKSQQHTRDALRRSAARPRVKVVSLDDAHSSTVMQQMLITRHQQQYRERPPSTARQYFAHSVSAAAMPKLSSLYFTASAEQALRFQHSDYVDDLGVLCIIDIF